MTNIILPLCIKLKEKRLVDVAHLILCQTRMEFDGVACQTHQQFLTFHFIIDIFVYGEKIYTFGLILWKRKRKTIM